MRCSIDDLSVPSASDQRSTATVSMAVEHTEYLGSYNWTDAEAAEMIVPGKTILHMYHLNHLQLCLLYKGSAPEWIDRSLPIQMKADKGTHYVDQNTFKSPTSVLLPLFRSVDVLNKEVDWPAVDVVTDRNGLRKLLRWINGIDVKGFRIDTELAGEQTVLFSRWEFRNRENLLGRTYGLHFEEAMTSVVPGCERSTSHHRIVKYVRIWFSLSMNFVSYLLSRTSLA